MSWPTPQDYNEAMQAPWLNLEDRALRSGKPALDFLGLPRPMTGAFASVYKLECEGRSYAIKLFLRKIADQQLRYEELSNAINSKELHYTVGFQYQPAGIRLKGGLYPILKMDWAEGDNLDLFVADHISEPRAIELLLHNFKKLVSRLQQYGVAHGDLQHGNILVGSASQLKLVDYDGMYVPRLRTFTSNELGHPNYQHPARSAHHFGTYLDNFAAWVIHTSLLCLSVDRSLWDQLSGGDDCLLFRRDDFEEPNSSASFRTLLGHGSEQIRASTSILKHLLNYSPDTVPALDQRILRIDQLPPLVQPSIQATASDEPTAASVSPAGGNGLPDWMQPGTVAVTKIAKSEINTGAWPRFDQYKQALVEPHLCFQDEELKQMHYIPEQRGLGKNGFVFHLRSPTKQIAIKCFRQAVPDREKRYKLIAKHVHGEGRRYFSELRYIPQGIRVDNYFYPVLVMDWLPTTLTDFIHQNMRFKGKLAHLSERFKNMIDVLQMLGIAHGDLEPDNLAIVNGEFKMLDYDGMYVPEMEGMTGIERGHSAFQHPTRTDRHFGPKLDYFAAWIMDAELSYLKIDPQLWLQAEMRSLASQKAAAKLEDMSYMEVHPSKQVRLASDVLRKLLDYDFETIPPFNARIPIFTLTHR